MTIDSMPLKALDIARLGGGVLTGNPEAVVIRGRADSRLCRPGDLYAALPGERTDGNLFVHDAWMAGADVALVSSAVSQPAPPPGKALVAVPDVLLALQRLAADIRRSAGMLRVVGITGSNGKTTTKEILAAILHARWGSDILVSEGNYNSDIGLPLTLLELRSHHRFAVLEMGMNKAGEMAILADIARPDIAVITNIGSAHVGMLGSRKALAAEKKSILSRSNSRTILIIPSDCEWTDFLLDGFNGQLIRFSEIASTQKDDVGFDSSRENGVDGQILVLNGKNVRFKLPGRHNRLNAAAATAAARAMDIDESAVIEGLETVRASFGRSEIIRGAITVIRDCYNSNPESLEMALDMFKKISRAEKFRGRAIIVIGEMLELGKETEHAVRKAGGAAAALNPDALFFFGSSLEPALETASASGYQGILKLFTGFSELEAELAGFLRAGDTVLLKGSRASALERLDQTIRSAGEL